MSYRSPILLLVISSLIVTVGKHTVAQEAGDRKSAQESSISDRVIRTTGHEAFRQSTAGQAVSPKLDQASAKDLVVRFPSVSTPDPVVVVVQKPLMLGGLYEIPIPPTLGNHADFLESHFEAASKQNVSTIRFPRSALFVLKPKVATGRHLKIESLRDVTVDFNGSTLKLVNASLGLLIQNCQRCTFRNGTILGSTHLASVAKVVADDSAAGTRFEVLPEYRQVLTQELSENPPLVTIGSVERGPNGDWQFSSKRYVECFVNREPKIDRFQYEPATHSFVASSSLSKPLPFNNGVYYVWLQHQNNAGHAVLLDNEEGLGNEDISFDQLRFSNIPGMVIVGEVVRGLHLRRIEVVKATLDPKPLFAASSDCVHLNANGGDIVIEDSFFDMNADDKVNIKGNYWKIEEVNAADKKVVVVPAGRKTSVNRWGWKGHKLVVIDGQFSVLAETRLASDSFRDSGRRHELTLEEIAPQVVAGALVANVDGVGDRVVIRNNRFVGSRAQGILVQSSHMLIESNQFEGIAGPPIKINLSLNDWFEAINPHNVSIKKNRFLRCAMSESKSSDLIYVHQYDGQRRPIEIIDGVELVGNERLEPGVTP